MGKAVRVRVKRKETDQQHTVLWIPEEATLEQVHCMMQILLNLEIWMPYAFMLMQQRRSIEKNMAAKFQVGKVFSENEVVWYDTEERSLPIVREEKKIYPNDPCPCGSGKKYKKCCGRK